MQVHSGLRDTLITFQSRAAAQDATYGTKTGGAWANLVTNPTEWAEVQDILPSRAENVADNIDLSRRNCRIRTLYRGDITPQHRVTIGARVLQIISGPVALGTPGRPEGLEMICVEHSSQGETP